LRKSRLFLIVWFGVMRYKQWYMEEGMVFWGTNRNRGCVSIACILLAGLGLSVVSCAPETKVSDTASVVSVDFSDNNESAAYVFTGLENQSVYLLKMNASGTNAQSGRTGYAQAVAGLHSLSGTDGVSASASDQSGAITRLDHTLATEFSANPAKRPTASSRSVGARATAKTWTVGSTQTYWIDYTNEMNQTTWTQVQATLRAQSTRANVWIMDEYYDASSNSDVDDKLTTEQAKSFAETFDKLYPLETAIFGYELGGGTSGDGGMDGDAHVNILIYDIDDDFKDNQTSGTVGYFWGKDCYTQAELDSDSLYANSGYKSNVSEIFYIDSFFADRYAGVTYSTLAHEFQHMIDFNVKYLTNGVYPETWYNEMLSLTVEDLFSPNLKSWLGDGYNVDTDGPIATWIPLYNNYYNAQGVQTWINGGDDVYYSYASAFAFGAYLMRNYGGVDLLHAIAANDTVGADSITAALVSVGAADATFDAVFMRYGEAFVVSSSAYADGAVPDTLNTFDRSVTSTLGGSTYAFSGFDIWTLDAKNVKGQKIGLGPIPTDASQSAAIPAYGLALQTIDEWLGVTGNLTVTVTKPSDSDVTMYLLVR
jgi:hypothetical protein